MWQAITYVTSGLTLAAFVAALVAAVILRQSRRLESQLKSADSDKKVELIKSTIVLFDVDTERLSEAQRYDIVIKQLAMKQSQFSWYIGLAAFAGLLFAAFAFYSVSQRSSSASMVSSTSPSDVTRSAMEACSSGTTESPNASSVMVEQAKMLSQKPMKLSLSWSGSLATQQAKNSRSEVLDAFVKDGLLFIRYDWQNGLIAMKPVMEAGTVPYVLYEGLWRQANGTGCIEMHVAIPEMWQSTPQGNLGGGIWFDRSSREGGWSLKLEAGT
ncbi:hypothetical protein [Rhizobium sp. RU36D]|uniref:hypothetical protein n=1 Tax=Rhizobium sp. RU36D TaxID=1907415 RepID=UPI0009D85C46|nr:hypothetical protein [Rhizobium sp. RU36D]SMD19624.1 hypothetical protein SAMN05880593_14227 [Rhizobium sp. RU36D]